MPALIAALLPLSLLVGGPLRPAALPASPVARAGLLYAAVEPPTEERSAEPAAEAGPLDGVLKFVGLGPKEGEEGMTIEKVASLGLAGVLSIAVAETVFWVLSFPTSELLYFLSTGEWIDLLTQEGQLKFLAFTAGWGALGGWGQHGTSPSYPLPPSKQDCWHVLAVRQLSELLQRLAIIQGLP